uniref:HMG box domain-containing protein n=1 Tax=Kalanchoe fedtschenkoi TaxID=63787 RepID=A0A7N0TZC2_KALFE
MTAKGASKSNPTKVRKRVEAVESSASLKRAKDGSAFAKCEECNKSIPAGLIDMHSCSLEAKIKMTLETQVVEITETKKKPAEKKKAKATKGEAKPSKKVKKDKDPNMPKRPPTAFFIFMDEFRKTYKEANPDNKSVSEVAKKGGEEWKSKTDEEKKQYVDKAKELKAEYERAMENYNAGKQEDEAGSDKETDEVEELQDDSD